VSARVRSTQPRLCTDQRRDQAASPAKRRIIVVTAVIAISAAMLVAGLWGLQAGRSGDEQAGTAPAGSVEVAGGWLRVREVPDRSINHQRMPGMHTMPDPDPVPKGYVRPTVDLSLAARDETLRWKSADFIVEGDGSAVRPRRAKLGDGVNPGRWRADLRRTAEDTAPQVGLPRQSGAVPLKAPRAHATPSGWATQHSDGQHDDPDHDE